MMTVLFIGDKPVRAAPSRTLAAALAAYQIKPVFSCGAEHESTRKWLQLVRQADALIVTEYDSSNLFRVRQLALAAMLGTPVIRWWVGSDVLDCLRHPAARVGAQLMNRISQYNVAVSPHLVEELESIGIASQTIPSVLERPLEPVAVDAGRPPHALLVYLPDRRLEFYRRSVVEQVVQANPDLTFIIVADDSHSLAHYPNVESVGWVEDLEAIWTRVGCLLRITEHDGMPRMVLDALRRGKYVIYSWPMEGCWHATTADEVQHHLDRFRMANDAHGEGVAAVQRLLAQNPAKTFAELIGQAAQQSQIRRRLRSFWTVVGLSYRLKRSSHQPWLSGEQSLRGSNA